MHTKTKRILLVINSTLLQAKYEPCRLAIRDSLLAMAEVVSCPAAVVYRRRDTVLSGTYEHSWALVRTDRKKTIAHACSECSVKTRVCRRRLKETRCIDRPTALARRRFSH